MQLHIDQLPRLTVPRNHSMSTRHHSPPAVAQCAFKDCNKDAFIIEGTASLCCSRSHLKYLQALCSKTRCALPGCNARSTLDRTYSLLTIFAVLTTPNWQINMVIYLK